MTNDHCLIDFNVIHQIPPSTTNFFFLFILINNTTSQKWTYVIWIEQKKMSKNIFELLHLIEKKHECFYFEYILTYVIQLNRSYGHNKMK